jgi:hypothetical protein
VGQAGIQISCFDDIISHPVKEDKSPPAAFHVRIDQFRETVFSYGIIDFTK